jgi:predicted alpha/beta hydrolase family esterase
MRAFFEKRGPGAEFNRQLSAARDLWRRDGLDADGRRDAPRGHWDHGAPQWDRRGPPPPRERDGAGWIERLSQEIGYDRVERAFYLLMGGVIFAGCVAIVMVGFSGSEPARPVEGVTEVQLAPPAPQETAAAPQENQNLSAAAPEKAPAAAPPAMAMRDNQRAAQEAAPQVTRNESASAGASVAETPPANEAPRETDMAMAAPNSAAEEAAPPAAEPEPAAPAARDSNADDKAGPAERAPRCFVKVSGRVLANGNCRVSRAGSAITFLHSGQPVTVSPLRGREWSLTLGGRKIGAVYKVGGCWGSRRHTWICEKGA